jgi:uracil-DNA glycosylase family protein
VDVQRKLEILADANPVRGIHRKALPLTRRRDMHFITLGSETDFDGWRKAARALALNDVKPFDVTWRVMGDMPELFEPTSPPMEPPHGTFNVPAKFVELADIAILHRNPERFALLYRLLWRLRHNHDLLDIATDPDMAEVTAMAKAVRRDEHKMHAFVRFREVGREQKSHFVAKAEIPTPGRLEETWRRYAANIFNPARLTTKMPSRRNLPQAPPVKPLIKGPMIADAETEPHAPQESFMARKHADDAIEILREEAADCRACPLYKNATQTVFGEGQQTARIMLVGEQPGDKEDLAGKPFVGPAGQMLDRALEEAGIDRRKVYVTNAVKHFKFVPRGKIRLHQKPNTPEIKACRQWYERELAAIKPDLVVAMGATAAQSVFGKITPINKNRGRPIDLEDGTRALVTVHPSYLLRLPDADAKAREYRRFVEDLKTAAGLLRRSARAA